jgi:hypothetical protein
MGQGLTSNVQAESILVDLTSCACEIQERQRASLQTDGRSHKVESGSRGTAEGRCCDVTMLRCYNEAE